MLRRYIYSIVCLLFILWIPGPSSGQNINLIPNGSFEDSTGCNAGYNFPYLKNWYNPLCNSCIPLPTPDYFNLCTDPFNYNYDTIIPPHSGKARAGCFVKFADSSNIREYIAAQLVKQLKLGMQYCITMYATSDLEARNGTDNLGVYFGVGHQFYNINTPPPNYPTN